jgi:plastocyanin
VRRPWVVFAASLALAGCGGETGGKHRALTLPAGAALTVTADEYSFDPDRITVAKPGELAVRVRNKGSLAHDLRIRHDGRDIGGTPAFQGGSRSFRIRLARGRYSFLCTVGDHAQLGMRGTIRVR